MLSVPVVVLRNLKAIRRVGRVNDDEIRDWVDELVRKLGPLDPERLQTAFDSSRDAHRAERRFGEVSVDDIVFTYERTHAAVEALPASDECSVGCAEGEIEMEDREGYTCLVPCSCPAGEYIRNSRKKYLIRSGPREGQRKSNVDELRMKGWVVRSHARRDAPQVDPKEAAALMKRLTSSVG